MGNWAVKTGFSFFKNIPEGTLSRAEISIQFTWIFGRLHISSNTIKVFGYTTNDFGALLLAYLAIIHIFKVNSIIELHFIYF